MCVARNPARLWPEYCLNDKGSRAARAIQQLVQAMAAITEVARSGEMRNGTSHTVEMIRELADFERELDQVDITPQDLLRDGFGTNPRFHASIAECDGQPAACTLYFFTPVVMPPQTVRRGFVCARPVSR